MVLLLIKKTFYDFWDNLYSMFLFGIITVVIAAFCFATCVTVGTNGLQIYAVIIGLIVCLGQFLAAMFFYTYDIAMNEEVKVRNMFGYISDTWKINLLISGILSVISILSISGIAFYLRATGPIAIVGTGVLAGTGIIVGLVLLFFYPFYIRSEGDIVESFKKSAFFISDNPVYVMGIIFGIAVIVAMSMFSYMIIPGLGAMVLWINVCVRTRLFKYDYRKATNTHSGDIPWEEVLKDDIEMYETRGFSKKVKKDKSGDNSKK